MNSSILLTHTSAHLLFSPFLNPRIPLRFKPPLSLSTKPSSLSLSRNHHNHKLKLKLISTVRCSTSSSPQPSQSPPPSLPANLFGDKRELTGLQSVVDSMSASVRLFASVIIFAGAVAAGYGLGLRIGGSRNASIAGAVAVGAAGAGFVYALNSAVPEVAAVNLHNYAADCRDPLALRKGDVQAIADKYGVSKQDEAFTAELSDIYCRYVSSVIPPGSEELRGDEAETIIKFKNALGIDDPDAASMHMEIGRRIFRQRLETGDRDGDLEQRRAFQKLIYVSTLIFGEASSFLLPWERVFKVTDTQVEVAVRDNAQRLYASSLRSVGRGNA